MRVTPLLFALFAGLATTAAQAASYTVTVTGTLSGAWDNAGIFGPARTSLNDKAFTATLEVDEETPGSFLALNTPTQRMLVGTYSASPVLGWLTVNGITRQVQPLQGTVFVINDHGAGSGAGELGIADRRSGCSRRFAACAQCSGPEELHVTVSPA